MDSAKVPENQRSSQSQKSMKSLDAFREQNHKKLAKALYFASMFDVENE